MIAAGRARSGLVIYTRRDCSLCDQMETAVRRVAGPGVPLARIEIDDQPMLRSQFGSDVPVLCLDGEIVCRHFLDARRLSAALGLDSGA